ncbi:hypothetical protein HDU99_010614 [Rhizoclosmatium hyalinum]|nr:hypothetical protein HDU99_010614 [Rhizoclosmatium hyalinum]
MQPSKIVQLNEIFAHLDWMKGETVRVLGRIKEADLDSSFVLLSYGSTDLLVDTSLIGILDKHSTKSLVQFIGDMEEIGDDVKITPFIMKHGMGGKQGATGPRRGVYLNARIMRNMDGLDIGLYEKALKARRVFDAERADLSF